jgi:hypothetical protein
MDAKGAQAMSTESRKSLFAALGALITVGAFGIVINTLVGRPGSAARTTCENRSCPLAANVFPDRNRGASECRVCVL